MKKRLLFSIGTFIIGISTVIGGLIGSRFSLIGEFINISTPGTGLYYLEFNKENPLIKDKGITVSGNIEKDTNLGNKVSFSYTDISRNNDTSAFSLINENSELHNVSKINGIRSITMKVTRSIRLEYGYSEDNPYQYSVDIPKGESTTRFEKGDPNYIKFSYLDYSSDIEFLDIQYSCSEGSDLSSIWYMKFNENPGETLYIHQYQSSDILDVVIPTTFNGYPVTKIGQTAFTFNKDITSVYIPDSITSIGYSVFFKCAELTSIFIPRSVTSMGKEAFAKCTNLTIYLEVDKVPSDWPDNWNSSTKGLVLGATRP